jgi:hypothetical protein
MLKDFPELAKPAEPAPAKLVEDQPSAKKKG